VVWAAKYTSFGEADIEDDSILENNLRFAGQYYDDETKLNYNHFRYYDEISGRYLTLDPIGYGGGLNQFVYVQGNPVNWADPHGLIKLGGNYIGPNYSAGQDKMWEETTPDERVANPPTGRLDEGALKHDKCYADCRSKFKCDEDKKQFKRCQNKCDRNLIKHNSRLQNKTIKEGIGGALINTGMLIQEGFRTPSINPSSNEPGTIFRIDF
jgi:RHS repeat-associated protein